jgi:ATP-dependent exoDNAse (exonuclease V) alpha subunit
MIIRGVAGTGKTTLEQEIGEALAETRKPVVAMAQSVKARDVLREKAGFADADTVAMFLTDQKMQEAARGGVILIDEASQLGTRDMHQVFEVAQRVNARVLLVGDRRQHRSVTAGEPLRLLEEKAFVPMAEVTEIVRQEKADYKKAAKALSEGRVEDAFKTLDTLGWITEGDGADRYQQLADEYLAAVAERKKDGTPKTALVVSPTHAEGNRVTDVIRGRLKEEGKLTKERMVEAWIPMHLTNAQKGDPTEYEPGDLIQFHQNAKGGYKKGTRLIVGEGMKLPMEVVQHYEVYRPVQVPLAVGDRLRITAGGKAKDGKKLKNGSLFTVQGFNRRGDLIVDGGRVIDREYGHVTHGYVLTSHASEGDSVSKVFVAISSESVPATNQRTAYVALTRGEEKVILFTDNRKELLKAMSRPDDPLSATELAETTNGELSLRDRLAKPLAMARRLAAFAQQNLLRGNHGPQRDMSHDR